MVRRCARWPECKREFPVSPFSPGQLYCCSQCKYQAALAAQRKKRAEGPKRISKCTICGTEFHPARNEVYCSGKCHREIENRQARERYKANGGKPKGRVPRKDLLAKLMKDPTDSWCVGHLFRMGQVAHDLKVDPTIWGDGVTFKTVKNGEIVIVRNGALVDEQGQFWLSSDKSDE